MKKQSLIESGRCPIDTTRRDKAEANAAPMRAQIDNHQSEPRIKQEPRPRKK